MRFSLTRASVAATAAALALAACAGHSMLPSSSSPDSAFGSDALGISPFKTKTTPCTKVQTPWIFDGSCAYDTLKVTGGSGSLATYKKISVKVTLSSGSQKAGTVVVVRDGTTPETDITGKVDGHKFPAFSVTGEKAFLYLAVDNTGKAFTSTKTPGIVITNAGTYPGKTCGVAALGTNFKWAVKSLPASLKGKVLTFSSVPIPFPLPAGSFYAAFFCRT